MGREIQIVRYLPPDDRWWGRDEDYFVGGCYPGPLMYAEDALERAGFTDGSAFPMLYRISPRSGNYVDEDLWLDSDQAELLLSDFRRLRAVCRGEIAVPSLNGTLVEQYWRDWRDPHAFAESLDYLDELLQLAVTGHHWVRMML